jgi:regulatory protein
MSLSEKENLGQLDGAKLDAPLVWEKITAYCAYQDRCIMEVRGKLEDLGVEGDTIASLVEKLVEQGFLDEKRFVDAFVRGRFLIKKWGKVRIRQELKLRGISEDLVREGISMIEPDQYIEVLNSLVERKWQATKESDAFLKKGKVQRFLLFRGFEYDLVRESLDRIRTQL